MSILKLSSKSCDALEKSEVPEVPLGVTWKAWLLFIAETNSA